MTKIRILATIDRRPTIEHRITRPGRRHHHPRAAPVARPDSAAGHLADHPLPPRQRDHRGPGGDDPRGAGVSQRARLGMRGHLHLSAAGRGGRLRVCDVGGRRRRSRARFWRPTRPARSMRTSSGGGATRRCWSTSGAARSRPASFPSRPAARARSSWNTARCCRSTTGWCATSIRSTRRSSPPVRWRRSACGSRSARRDAIHAVYSPSHQDRVFIERDGDYRALVGYEESDVLPDQDFELVYTVSQEDVGLNLLTYREARRGRLFPAAGRAHCRGGRRTG